MTALDEYKTIFAKLEEVQAENDELRAALEDTTNALVDAVLENGRYVSSTQIKEHYPAVTRAIATLNASDK